MTRTFCQHFRNTRQYKSLRVIVTVAGVLLITITAFAVPADARSVYFMVEGGGALQSGPDSFQETFDNGLGGAAVVGFNTGSNIDVVGRVEYYRFGWHQGSTSFDFGSVGAFLFSASTMFSFNDEDDAYRPFFIVGYGTADLSRNGGSDEIITQYDSDDLQGFFQLGAGVDFRLTDMFRLQITGRYISVNSASGGEATSFFPLTVGIRF